MNKSNTGFTIVEVLVAMFIFILTIFSIISLATSIQQAQRNNNFLALATQGVNSQIEVYRDNSASVTACGGPPYDRSSDIGSTMLQNPHMYITVTCVDQVYGIKRVDVQLTYEVGPTTKKVQSSTYIGNGGIYQ